MQNVSQGVDWVHVVEMVMMLSVAIITTVASLQARAAKNNSQHNTQVLEHVELLTAQMVWPKADQEETLNQELLRLRNEVTALNKVNDWLFRALKYLQETPEGQRRYAELLAREELTQKSSRPVDRAVN